LSILSVITISTFVFETLDNYATKSRFFGSTFNFELWGPGSPFSATLDSGGNRACFIVQDDTGQLVYVILRTRGPPTAADLLTRDEAWRIPANIGRLAEVLGVEGRF
jgi:hypothetical protein